MKEIILKLDKIKDQIIADNTDSVLRVFALVARTDVENKWDVLISGDWVEKINPENELINVIEKIKKEFNNNLDFLAQIVVFPPTELFIKLLGQTLINEDLKMNEEINSLKIADNLIISKIVLLYEDFSDMDLTIPELASPKKHQTVESF